MDKDSIIDAIDKRVKSTEKKKYSIWTIGITNDPERRKGEHNNPKYWMDWKADSEQDARDIEEHFKKKEMKGGLGGGGNPTHVYIF